MLSGTFFMPKKYNNYLGSEVLFGEMYLFENQYLVKYAHPLRIPWASNSDSMGKKFPLHCDEIPAPWACDFPKK